MKKRGNQDFPFNDVSPSEDRFNTELVKPSEHSGAHAPVLPARPSADARTMGTSPSAESKLRPQTAIPKDNSFPARPAFDAAFFDDQAQASPRTSVKRYDQAPRPRQEEYTQHGRPADYRDSYDEHPQKLPSSSSRRTLDLQIQILSIIAGVMLVVVLILLYLAIFGGSKASAASASASASISAAATSGYGAVSPAATTLGVVVSVTPDPSATTTPSGTTADTDPSSLANMPPSAEHPVIALTFDDGPSRTLTPQLLDVLKEKGVPATFFLLGVSVADADPALLQRMIDEGHEIGNHSYDHKSYKNSTEDEIREQLQKTNDLIYEAIGVTPTIMRPPNGESNDAVLALSNEFGMAVVNWSYQSCPSDWVKENQTIEYLSNYVIDNASNGHIVLLHDIHQATVDSIAPMIDGLRAKGYRFVTVSELLESLPSGKQTGVVYYYGTE